MTSKHQRATDSVTLKDIYAASQQIKATIRRTPLDHSQELSALVGAEIRLKMENLQQTGSFKLRGRQTFLPIWMQNSAALASSPQRQEIMD
ncbi:pyridoxal-phosphate dependent enzyme [Pectobacterium carotovorum subsp. carotovorum]|nr:pyridoxal-phosphate dependent enzyme [Pectobacterium carotovorum]QHP58915.1 pyridoxal-phosphate dependent enzyme [Pectobacterium carotovorum subsp. carotovorum]